MKDFAQDLTDTVDSLRAELETALEVLYRRGDVHARDWLWLNYPAKTRKMATAEVARRRRNSNLAKHGG